MSIFIAILALTQAASPAPARTASQIVEQAPASAWRPIAAENLLLIDLQNGGRVVIELAPEFAPVHVANIRTLASTGWWDDARVNRSQDNYVVQWGDPTEKKPLPQGVVAAPPAEYDRAAAWLKIRPLGFRDAYAPIVGHLDGWPVASDGTAAWLPHCYGMVGVGRNNPPDTGNGAELYAANGHAPRNLDRNLAVVGRVIDGFALFTALPRGTEALGFYKTLEEKLPFKRVRLASDLPEAERPRYEVMRTDAPVFGELIAARAGASGGFWVRAAGAMDLCSARVPVRPVK